MQMGLFFSEDVSRQL